jgi:hypothetical protein
LNGSLGSGSSSDPGGKGGSTRRGGPTGSIGGLDIHLGGDRPEAMAIVAEWLA